MTRRPTIQIPVAPPSRPAPSGAGVYCYVAERAIAPDRIVIIGRLQ